MGEATKKISPNMKYIQGDMENLSEVIDDLNTVIDNKSRYIEKSKKELKQLKELSNLVKDFSTLPFKSKLTIFFIEARINELEITINIESLNRKFLQRIRQKKQALKKKNRFIINIHSYTNKISKQK